MSGSGQQYPTDDGLPWGFVTEAGQWVPLPKIPLLLAGLGPPPFDVVLPSGATRHVVHAPPAAPAAPTGGNP